MNCPNCYSRETSVNNTKNLIDQPIIKRQRMCKNCNTTFSTIELRQPPSKFKVVKQDGTIDTFSYEQLYESIKKTCKNLSVPFEDQRHIFQNIMTDITQKTITKERINSEEIGELVINYLAPMNRVAWLRYVVHFYDSEVTIRKRIESWVNQ